MGMSAGFPGEGWKKWWVVKRIDTGKEMVASEDALEPVKPGTKKAGETYLFGGKEVRLLYIGEPDHGEPTWAVCLLESGNVIRVHEVALRPVKTGTKIVIEASPETVQRIVDGWKNKDPRLLSMLMACGFDAVTDIRVHQ